MVEMVDICVTTDRRQFILLYFKSKQFFNVKVQGHVHVHCIFKVTFLVQVQEAVFRE